MFAAGKVIYIADELDLVDVAFQMSRDNADQIKFWMKASKLSQVTDEQAKQWQENGASLWAVVVRPWVLVQEGKANA